jgi:hypothetical protein
LGANIQSPDSYSKLFAIKEIGFAPKVYSSQGGKEVIPLNHKFRVMRG